MHGGERSLLTWGSANDQLDDDHLRSTFDALSDYLSGARIVHVTSRSGDRDPAVLLRLLEDVRLFDAGPLLLDPLRDELIRCVPAARLSPPPGQAADGALLLARRGLPAQGADRTAAEPYAIAFTGGESR